MMTPGTGASDFSGGRRRGRSLGGLFQRAPRLRAVAQAGAAGLVFGVLFISCVSTDVASDDTRPILTEDDALYGEITGDLDAPLWDEGDGQNIAASDNPIDRALSQSPYEPEHGSSKASLSQKSKKKTASTTYERKVKKASKHKPTPSHRARHGKNK